SACDIYSNSYDGIYLEYSSSNNISACDIYSNSYDGILLYYSPNNIISACNIHGNSYDGIFLYYYSNHNTISECTIYGNSYDGIFLYFSSNNNISACNIYSNSYDGILLYYSPNNIISACDIYSNYYDGILLYYSPNNIISACNIYSNSYYGILLYYSPNNIISACTIYGNSYEGIYLDSSSNNLIYNNYFDNKKNAYSYGGSGNLWNITKTLGTNIVGGYYLGGNYWSDYTGTDTNGDGLGDTPYTIPGGSKEEDKLPLVKPMEFTFNLNSGWNLIALPLNTSYNRAEDLAQAIDSCKIIGRWNASSQSFEYHEKGTNTNNFTIEYGCSYFVYVTVATSFTIKGYKITSVSIGLDAGWNAIGWFNETATDAESLAKNITNCTAVAYWDNTLGRFVQYIVGTEISNFNIERGCGYLVYVTTDTTWTNS
ncbi:MAG: NosD domain-containing protein, partial [Candidatus Thermoplasmatota archaeon]